MFDLIDKYVDELKEDSEFQRLMELKKLIDKKYSSLIVAFKTCESKYEEMKQYGSYASNLDKLKRDFMEAKGKLYSKEEVVEYFHLESKLQNKLTRDLNEIKSSISNKFKLNKGFNFFD